eukprot:TRINITY_DN4459_c0_g1_i1.p1 TRINITY_DN4459_c0_g1~~TRINITY_DN4459_c0_g1_i1.p1  ORF type:complete len:401 (-),score=76.64 TRINITY_DN4459_c0_g1_i1:232-1434(-)
MEGIVACCSICLDGYESPVITQCGHVFCCACIEKSFLFKESCPECKQVIDTTTIPADNILRMLTTRQKEEHKETPPKRIKALIDRVDETDFYLKEIDGLLRMYITDNESDKILVTRNERSAVFSKREDQRKVVDDIYEDFPSSAEESDGYNKDVKYRDVQSSDSSCEPLIKPKVRARQSDHYDDMEYPKKALKRRKKKKKTEVKQVVICSTNLSDDDTNQLRKIAKRLGATVIDEYDETATHIVSGVVDSSKTIRRTMKYFYGILNGQWIVNNDWINQSYKSKQWISEKKFEIKRDTSGPCDGPRLGRATGKSTLFDSLSIYLHSTDLCPPKKELKQLIEYGGGTVIKRLKKNGSGIIVICSTKKAMKLRRDYKIEPISVAWLLDCVSKYELLPFEDYTM